MIDIDCYSEVVAFKKFAVEGKIQKKLAKVLKRENFKARTTDI